MHVSFKGNSLQSSIVGNLLQCNPQDLEFKLTTAARNEGFSETDLDFLKSKWFTCAEIVRKFDRYNFYITKISLGLLGSLYLCWLSISLYFFNHKFTEIHMEGLFASVFRRYPLRPGFYNFQRLPPREGRFVREGHSMNVVKVATDVAYHQDILFLVKSLVIFLELMAL